MIFELGNKIYNIERNHGETDNYINDKGWFIVYQNPKNNTELKQLDLYGSIYANIVNYKCSYNKEIIKKINILGENCPFFEKINL